MQNTYVYMLVKVAREVGGAEGGGGGAEGGRISLHIHSTLRCTCLMSRCAHSRQRHFTVSQESNGLNFTD